MRRRELISRQHRESGQKTEVQNQHDGEELEKVARHLFQAGDQGAKIGVYAEDRAEARYEEERFETEHVERGVEGGFVATGESHDSRDQEGGAHEDDTYVPEVPHVGDIEG